MQRYRVVFFNIVFKVLQITDIFIHLILNGFVVSLL